MKVRARTVVFVGNALRQEGDVFDYDGPDNRHLEPLEQPVEVEPELVAEPVVQQGPVVAEEAPAKWRPKRFRAGAN
jgi:hypothetical protein